MKKWLILLIAGMVFISCNKAKVDLLFGKLPEERMVERNTQLKEQLRGAPNGWKAVMKTSLKGTVYGFYMAFDDQNRVSMLTDFNPQYSSSKLISTYRVQYISNATLIFDTYNYITLLQDPNGFRTGGEIREGYQSDIEFEYLHHTEDSIVLRGRKYKNFLYLIKASAEDAAAFEKGEYATAITHFDNLFPNTFPTILLNQNEVTQKIGLTTDKNQKLIFANYLTKENTLAFDTSSFAYAIDGAYFPDGLTVYGIRFTSIRWKGSELVSYDAAGKEYPMELAEDYPIPFELLFGMGYKFLAYSGTTYPKTTPQGSAIMAQYLGGIPGNILGHYFNQASLSLKVDVKHKILTVEGWHKASDYEGTSRVAFNYTLDEATGIYTFTLKTPAEGGLLAHLLNEPGKPNIQDFLLNNKVKFNLFKVNGASYGKLSSVTDPSIVMTWGLTL